MSLIGRFEHLPNRPKSDEARPLLEKIASQVKPIMSKRGWSVGTLAEFLPSNPALLGNNMNAGERINLRLRPPGDVNSFYEYDQLVLVMLHELTHIEHGPHNAAFYKLLGELEEEYYDLKRKGYSGEGFHGQGNHLSGFKVPEYVGKAKGLAAAQKRLEVQQKIGKGGVLGGKDVKGRSMKEVLAEAAERRIRDDKACQSQDAGHAREVEEEVRRAQEESVGIDAIDLSRDDEEGEDGVAGSGSDGLNGSTVKKQSRESSPEIQIIDPPAQTVTARAPRPPSTKTPAQSTSASPKPTSTTNTSHRQHVPSKRSLNPSSTINSPSSTPNNNKPSAPHPQLQPDLALSGGDWSCPTCTLINPPSAQMCDACTTTRPSIPLKTDDGWFCEFCGSGPRDMGFWSCVECGWVRKWG